MSLRLAGVVSHDSYYGYTYTGTPVGRRPSYASRHSFRSGVGGQQQRSGSMSRTRSHQQQDDREKDTNDVSEEESEDAKLERLGRQRPEKFKSTREELGFCFSIIMSQVLTEYFVSGFNVVLPTVADGLNIPPASTTWPANAFSLAISCFLLFFGRLCDMYGGFPIYTGGMAWLAVWSLISGWSQNELMMDICRGIAGLGPSAYLPASLMLLGSVYRPGPRKNIVFSVYGACAAVGFYVGIFFAGVTAQFTTWRWYFFIGAILAAITAVSSYIFIPSDTQERKDLGVKMDWAGAVLISCGLILVVFAITDSSHAPQGWATPYIYALLIVGVLFLAVAVYIEGWVAEQPLLPFDLFSPKYMKPLVIALFIMYGSLGIFLLYATFYLQDIAGTSPMLLVAYYSPMAAGGIVIATVGGFLLHVVPGTILILFSGVCWMVSPLLFALAPYGANYWAWVFPAMICATLAIDITFNVTNIFITSALPLRRQGLAGALINSILQLGIAFFLGLADVVNTYLGPPTAPSASPSQANVGPAALPNEGNPPVELRALMKGYKSVFYYEFALAAFAFFILVAFVRVGKQTSELTADEKNELEKELSGEQQEAAGVEEVEKESNREEGDAEDDKDESSGAPSPVSEGEERYYEDIHPAVRARSEDVTT